MKRKVLLVLLPGFLSLISSAQLEVSPGLARVSLIQGYVSQQRGDTGDWAAAALNQPLAGGDRISTGDNSKAEVQLDHGDILRLGNNSQAKIATVERTQIQVQIGRGLAYYTGFRDSEAAVEIDTPNAAIRPTSREGVYRVEVTGFETQVVVRAGAVDIATPRGNARVEAGQAVTIRGTTDDAGNVMSGAPASDDWDSWSSDRDSAIRNAQSWNYTNHYYVGSEDLDAYGHWVNVPEYGKAWAPTVAGGWTPYHAGRWVWEPHWRWTWVSREPWGWAPYHYGRWLLYGKSWMWWPGPLDGDSNYRPEWAPAYVSFFGFGGHKGAGAGFGSVGWLPIGPGDSFYPWYGRTGSQLSAVNVTEAVTDATSITKLNRGNGVVPPLRDDDLFSNVGLAVADGHIRKAISVLRADRFGTGHSAGAGVSGRALRDGRIITGTLPIIPTRETLSATNRPANPSSIVIMSGGRPERFFTKRQPAAAESLDRQVAQIQESIQASGQLVPVRETTQMDSAGSIPMPIDNGVERRDERTKDVAGGRRTESGSQSRAQAESRRELQESRSGASARAAKSNSKATRRVVALAPASRGAKARTAAKSSGASRTAALSRVPTSSLTSASASSSSSSRRMTTLAAGPRGSSTHAAKSYIDSANREMDKGNYTAAIAAYKRASQFDGNNGAARARLARARRAMQAENEIIANRR